MCDACGHLNSWHEPVTGKCRAFECNCIHATPAPAPHVFAYHPLMITKTLSLKTHPRIRQMLVAIIGWAIIIIWLLSMWSAMENSTNPRNCSGASDDYPYGECD